LLFEESVRFFPNYNDASRRRMEPGAGERDPSTGVPDKLLALADEVIE
jgi:hypothetical protein